MKKTILSKTLCAICIGSSLFLTGCGGSDSKSDNTPKPQQPQQQKEQITGTVATGAALTGALVEVINKNGVITKGTTDAKGKFTIEADKGAPYLIKATKGDTILYSYSATSGYVNVTQLTSQAILAANASSEDPAYHSLDAIFTNWKELLKDTSVEEINEALTETQKEAIANLKTVFETNGFGATKGYPDLFKYEFEADSTGFDKVLDSVVIMGLSSECTGTGTAYHCDVSYKVDGSAYTWSYDISTSGIDIVIDWDDPTIPSGSYNLKVTTTVMGTSNTVTVKNVPKPENRDQFCASEDLYEYFGSAGSFKLNSCSFSGNVGSMNATVTASGMSFTYDVKYEYSPS